MKSYVKKLIIGIMVSVQLISSVGVLLAYDLTNANQGKVFTNAKVDTSIPTWFKPSSNKDIKYWLSVLPYEEYRYHDQYIVIPAMGLVAPIVELDKTSEDYKNVLKGKSFDYDKYLQGGPTIYPGTASIGTTGNTFLFGHSNFWHNDAGKFKTIFRITYNLEKGDKIWAYKKIGGVWVFFEYTVTISKKIAATDTWALLPEKGKATITISACRPIGTARERWMNRAELTSVSILSDLLKPNSTATITKKVNVGSTERPPTIIRKTKTTIITPTKVD